MCNHLVLSKHLWKAYYGALWLALSASQDETLIPTGVLSRMSDSTRMHQLWNITTWHLVCDSYEFRIKTVAYLLKSVTDESVVLWILVVWHKSCVSLDRIHHIHLCLKRLNHIKSLYHIKWDGKMMQVINKFSQIFCTLMSLPFKTLFLYCISSKPSPQGQRIPAILLHHFFILSLFHSSPLPTAAERSMAVSSEVRRNQACT